VLTKHFPPQAKLLLRRRPVLTKHFLAKATVKVWSKHLFQKFREEVYKTLPHPLDGVKKETPALKAWEETRKNPKKMNKRKGRQEKLQERSPTKLLTKQQLGKEHLQRALTRFF